MSDSVTLWTVAHQAPLSVGFSRQEHWGMLPCHPPRDLPNPGTEPKSLKSPVVASRFFITGTTWEVPVFHCIYCLHVSSSVNGHPGCFHFLAFLNSCCYEHWGACIFLNWDFVWIYTQEWDCWNIWWFYFQFSEELIYVFHSGFPNLHSHQ